MLKARIAVLVSGNGTNLQQLIDRAKEGSLPHGELVAVISSNKGAYALTRAELAHIPGVVVERKDFATREAFEDQLQRELEKAGADLVVLAGFMHILSPEMARRWPGRMVNVHPSLIPAFCGRGYYGLKVHEAALKRGVKITGATVHLVNEEPDGGPILKQRAVAVMKDDTPYTLQQRVMAEAEWQLLPQAVEELCASLCGEEPVLAPISMGAVIDGNEYLRSKPYPGRGLMLGIAPDGRHAIIAYFLMGRSVNSRNRILTPEGEGLRTQAFDPSLVTDPSLIIYSPLRVLNNYTIISNGDQTDAIYHALASGGSMGEALMSCCYEPDEPNYTPRISGLVIREGNYCRCQLSELKRGASGECQRLYWEYPAPRPAVGRLIHTYQGDGEPLPSFSGEPLAISVSGDIDRFTAEMWDSLDQENRVSLFVRYLDLVGGGYEDRIINKHLL